MYDLCSDLQGFLVKICYYLSLGHPFEEKVINRYCFVRPSVKENLTWAIHVTLPFLNISSSNFIAYDDGVIMKLK